MCPADFRFPSWAQYLLSQCCQVRLVGDGFYPAAEMMSGGCALENPNRMFAACDGSSEIS